jgi:hypothetical protein
VRVSGSLIGTIAPVNKKLVPPGAFELNFEAHGDVQEITEFEGGPPDTLVASLKVEGGGEITEPGAQACTDSLNFATTAKIKA